MTHTNRDVIVRRWGDARGVQGQAPVLRADGHVLTLERAPHLTDEQIDALAERYAASGLRQRGVLFWAYVEHPDAIERAARMLADRLPRLDLARVEQRTNPPAPETYHRRLANGMQVERTRPLDARWRHGQAEEVNRG